MPAIDSRILYPILLVLCIGGCASATYTRGRAELEREEYDAAIASFQEALEEDPDNPEILRDLGAAHYRKGDYDASVQVLTRALELDSTDGLTLYYLGTAYEIMGNNPEAIDKYRRYSQIGANTEFKRLIEGRLQHLIREQIDRDIETALATEKSIDVEEIPDNTVAVLYFKNIGQSRELDPIQKGLAEMLITDLSKAKSLNVIERVRMQKLLEEMGLGMTGLVDEASAPRVGRLLGTSELVNGTFFDLDEDKLRIDAGITRTRTAEFAMADQVSGSLEGFFYIEKTLVFRIIDKMGIELTQEEKDQIQIIPTENLLAFLAFCQGLDYVDRGMFDEAIREFQKAVELDPEFALAREKKEESEAYVASEVEITEWVREMTDRAPAEAINQEPLPDLTVPDRLQQTGQSLGAGAVPGVDSRNPLQEQNQQTFGNSAGIEIEVNIPP